METEHGFYFFFAFTKKSKYHKFYKLKLKQFSNNEYKRIMNIKERIREISHIFDLSKFFLFSFNCKFVINNNG